MLPFILAMTLFSILSATIITKFGMPAMVMLGGTILACVGSGLIYTLGINSSAGKWIGFLVIVGLGYGGTLQLAIIVGQASALLEDIPITTAAVNCIPI
jgi:MFS transporter, DHA2 family, glioxin efflux transporter